MALAYGDARVQRGQRRGHARHVSRILGTVGRRVGPAEQRPEAGARRARGGGVEKRQRVRGGQIAGIGGLEGERVGRIAGQLAQGQRR